MTRGKIATADTNCAPDKKETSKWIEIFEIKVPVSKVQRFTFPLFECFSFISSRSGENNVPAVAVNLI